MCFGKITIYYITVPEISWESTVLIQEVDKLSKNGHKSWYVFAWTVWDKSIMK